MDSVPADVVHHQSSKPSSTLSKQQIMDAYIVVVTLWMEARGEGEQGMQAVMNTIMNRSKGNFENSRRVVLKPKQFSCWNGISNPEQKTIDISKKHRNEKEFQIAIKLVDAAMKGKLKDITDGATHYFNPHKVLPTWSKKMKKTVSIKNHDFYKTGP